MIQDKMRSEITRQLLPFSCSRGANDSQSGRSGKLNCRRSNAARRAVNQNSFPR
jgi:hypothetical protein